MPDRIVGLPSGTNSVIRLQLSSEPIDRECPSYGYESCFDPGFLQTGKPFLYAWREPQLRQMPSQTRLTKRQIPLKHSIATSDNLLTRSQKFERLHLA